MVEQTKVIFLKVDSRKYGVRIFLKIDTPHIDPEEGGFVQLDLEVDGVKIGHVIIDWQEVVLEQLSRKDNDYLVAHANIDEVDASLKDDDDLTQLIVEAVRKEEGISFAGLGFGIDRTTLDTQFEAWVTKNI